MQKKQESKGRHIRFPKETDAWLNTHARKSGFRTSADVVRHAVREYRQKIEAGARVAKPQAETA
jgi:Arc/MetJ-type ribon-helix-helix transcriptional regulator